MSVASPYQIPGLNPVAVVQNPVSNQNSDTQTVNLAVGRHGDALGSDVHGKYFQAASRGGVFLGSTVAAGVALPFNAINLASKFTLWNPVGSGVNLEPIEFGVGIDSATTIVNGIVAGFQFNLSSPGGTLTALTTCMQLSGGGAVNVQKAILYSANTLVNAAVLAPLLPIFGGFGAVTDAALAPDPHKFDGKVVLPPGSLMTFCTTVTGGETAMFCGITWAEWPI